MEENEFENLPQLECVVTKNQYALLDVVVTNTEKLERRIISGRVYYIGRIGDRCAAIDTDSNWYLGNLPGQMRVSNASPHDFATVYVEHQAVLKDRLAQITPSMPDAYGDW